MGFPLLENPTGEFCYLNGQKISFEQARTMQLFEPVDEIIYYESIRIKEGIFLFFENHMLRLLQSITAKEDFPLDTDVLYEQGMKLLKEASPKFDTGNLRIAVTKSKQVVYFSQFSYPDEVSVTQGIVTAQLKWERVDPQVKIIHDDYKAAIAAKLLESTPFGYPFELLLTNSREEITEGSRSNFFVLIGDKVYSPPNEIILIGITRRYVLAAIKAAGFHYQERLFTLDQLKQEKEKASSPQDEPALFITSSPFDILPVASVDDIAFSSGSNEALKAISQQYQKIVQHYILTRQSNTQREEDI